MATVSIITALHNKGPYVKETIHSVLAQTMPDWELIVVENGSTDNGPGVVREFSDPRIRMMESPKHGPGAARNCGLTMAAGEWILFLDADDLIEPDYLDERLGLLRINPLSDLLAGCWEEFPDGRDTERLLRFPTAKGGTAQDVANAAIAHAPWALHAALVKKELLSSGRLWPVELDGLPSEDTAFWFPLLQGARVAWSEKAGALYRIQTKSSRNQIKDPQRWIHAVMKVIQRNTDYLKMQNISPNQRQCASIMRVLESTYRLGISRSARSDAVLALHQANKWLDNCHASSPQVMMRKILGLRLFNFIRYGVI